MVIKDSHIGYVLTLIGWLIFCIWLVAHIDAKVGVLEKQLDKLDDRIMWLTGNSEGPLPDGYWDE